MANVANIQILRSYTNTAPTTLLDGQLAYSFVSNTLFIGSNTGIITIGDPSTKQVAQSSYDKANSANVLAQAAFNAANSAGSSAFTQAAFDKANSANSLAQSAYNAANAAGSSAFTQSAFDKANSANVLAQSSYDFSNTINVFTQSAYSQANASNVLAQAAFNAANAAGSSSFTQAAFDKANSANVLAQSSYNFANTVNSYSYSSNVYLQGLISSTNTAMKAYGDTTYFNKTGGTISGAVSITNDLTVTGNLSILGNSTTISANSLSISDPLILLSSNNYTSDLLDIGLVGHYNAGQNAHTGIIRDPNLKEWIFFQGYTPEVQANNLINISDPSFAYANVYASYHKGNLIANTAVVNGVDVFTFTNSAFNQANSAVANVIILQGNTSPNLYNTSISSSVNSISVGGAPVQNAAVWKTYTMVQVLDAILFPTLGPTYTIPTITLSANNSGTLEIGQTINQSLTVTGTKNDAGAFTQLRINRNAINLTANNSPPSTPVANIAAQYGYSDPNNQNYSYANTYIDSNTIVSGATTWTGYGNYSAGLAKLTNKGTTDTNAFAVLTTTAPQAANAATFATTSVTVTGIYPYFWGVSSTQPTAASIASAIQAGTATKVLAVGSGTLTITYNASSQYIWLAVQTGYAAKTTWYNTALNNGSIGAGQFILSPVSQAVTSPSAYWSGVTFNIYISGYATTTSGSLQFS